MQKITLYLTDTEYNEFYEKNAHYFTHFKTLTETVKKKPDIKLERAKGVFRDGLAVLATGFRVGHRHGSWFKLWYCIRVDHKTSRQSHGSSFYCEGVR